MKSTVTCSVDSEIIKEARRRKIPISQTLEKALEVETALTNGIEGNKIKELLEERKREIKLLEIRLAELEAKDKAFELIKNMPEVKDAVEKVRDCPGFFEGRLRLLQNNHINITREQFLNLINEDENA